MGQVSKYKFIERFNEPVLTPSATSPMICGYKQFNNDNRSYLMSPCYMSSNLVCHLIHSSRQCYESGAHISPIFPMREPRPEKSSNLAKVPELHDVNQDPAGITDSALTSTPHYTASLNILLWFLFVYMSIFHVRLDGVWVTTGFSHLFNPTAHLRWPTNVEC